MSATSDEEEWDSDYTEGCKLRIHLGDMARVLYEAYPPLDAEKCRATVYPEGFSNLVTSWNNCVAASRTIHQRYQEDSAQGGVLAEIAAEMRDRALWGLKEAWEIVSAQYVSETLEVDRQPWDCPYCGVPVPTEHVWDDGRCPSCMVILEVRPDKQGWC